MTVEELRQFAEASLRTLEERVGRDSGDNVTADAAKLLEALLHRMCALVSDDLSGPDLDRFNQAVRVAGQGKPRSKLTLGEWVDIWQRAALEDAWDAQYGLNREIQSPVLPRVTQLRASAVHPKPVAVSRNDVNAVMVELRYFVQRFRLVSSGSGPPVGVERTPEPGTARGWIRIDAAFLDQRKAGVDADFVRFFDGATPGFAIAQDPRLPVMPVVDDIERDLQPGRGVTINLVKAPTGEGKTTLLMQLACRLARQPDTHVYWLDEATAAFDPLETRRLVAQAGRTVLVIDRMDEQVDRLVDLVRGQHDVLLGSPASLHVVGAARAYRWERARDRIAGINAICSSRMHEGVGFDQASAADIVACWAGFGAAGLRSLQVVDAEARADHLYEVVQDGRGRNDSLFGGLLRVRLPTAELKAHLATLLDEQARMGEDIRDAYVAIAIVDALEVDGLDDRVLSDAIGASLSAFRQRVRPALEGEAGVVRARGGQTGVLQTRHRDIARAAVAVATEKVGVERLQHLLTALVQCALRLGTIGELTVANHADLTHCSVWIERRLGAVLGGRVVADEVAVQVARVAWEAESRPDYLAELLTRLRRVGAVREATDLARAHWSSVCATADRADAVRSVAWHWAGCAAAFHDEPTALWLAMLSISDQVRRPGAPAADPVSPMDMKKGLVLLADMAEKVGLAAPLEILRPLGGLRDELPTAETPDPGESWAPAEPVPPAHAVRDAMALVESRLDGLDVPVELLGQRPLTFDTFTRVYGRQVSSRFGPLLAYVPRGAKIADEGELVDSFQRYLRATGLRLYPEQEDAILVLATGDNLLLNTPTGSGKSLVGVYAHFAALCRAERSAYTAPTKALVNEKFFQLCHHFGARNVGIATGDATVNSRAPILCCTAEVLASMALDDRDRRSFACVVMDEFHYYDDRQRGMAWLLPLLEMPDARFVLLSATVGRAREQCARIERQTRRATTLVQSEKRPVPLEFAYKEQVLRESLVELRDSTLVPAYVVSFAKLDAARLASETIRPIAMEHKAEPERVERRRKAVLALRFDTPYGRTLRALLQHGVAVHHSGLLPRYRRIVERLTGEGHVNFISGTDTLGVGVNLPIRSVLITQLYKFDGRKSRHLDAREFHQVAGRAGRKGHDDVGTVWVQAPEHKMQLRLDKAKKGKKIPPRAVPNGYMDWGVEKYEALRGEAAQPLNTRFRVDGRLVMAMLGRRGDGRRQLHDLIDRAGLVRREAEAAHARADELIAEFERRGRVRRAQDGERWHVDHLDEHIRLERPLLRWLHRALAAEELDHREPGFAMKVVSVVESVLNEPSSVLQAQRWAARRLARAERSALRSGGDDAAADALTRQLDEHGVEIPQPEKEFIERSFATWLNDNPWYEGETPAPRSILREMYELQFGFNDYVAEYELQVNEGQLMKYMSEAYRIFAMELPGFRYLQADAGLIAFREWLYGMVRSVDASLVHEWERLVYAEELGDVVENDEPPPPQVVLDSPEFRRQVRTEAFGWARAVARRDAVELASDAFPAPAAKAAVDRFFAEHRDVRTDADARGPQFFACAGLTVRQRLLDTEDAHDWEVVGEVDREASMLAGRPIVRVVRIGLVGA